MRVSPLLLLRDARAMWARDRAILAPLSGLFLFVPQWATLLLVPPMPAMPTSAEPAAVAAVQGWMQANAATYLVAMLLVQFGTLAVATLYVGRGAGSAKGALTRAAALFGRFLLASLAVAMPLALLASLLLAVIGAALGPVVAIALYVAALTLLMLVAPAVAAGDGAVAAVARAWRASRGHRGALVSLTAGVIFTAWIVGGVIVAGARGLGSPGAANPIALALVEALAAGVLWAASLTLALVGVAAYRALAR